MDGFDDYDFTPSSSSNLRSLFDSSMTTSGAPSLTYTAPKQPKTGPPPETPKSDTSVVCARVVQVWKLDGGKYVGIGKLGLAVIVSSVQESCEMILYKDKTDVIVRVKVNQDFEICLKKDDFASFYDCDEVNWLVKFNSKEDSGAVATHIKKYSAQIRPESTEKVHNNVATTHEEVVQTSDSKRADILTRIAKMGQSMLPNKTEEEPDIPETTLTPAKFVPPERQLQNVPNTVVMTQNVPNAAVVAQPVGYYPMEVYMTENRAQNCELRMNLSHISEKLNSIMKFVENGKSGSDEGQALASRIKVLELQRENLLRELSNTQEENALLKSHLDQQKAAVKNNEESDLKLKQLELEMRVKTEEMRQQEGNIEKQRNEIEKLQQQVQIYKDKVGEIPKLENRISELQQQLDEAHNQQTQPNFAAVLKEGMNELYATLTDNFQDDQHKAVIAQSIKATTLKIIHNFQPEK